MIREDLLMCHWIKFKAPLILHIGTHNTHYKIHRCRITLRKNVEIK